MKKEEEEKLIKLIVCLSTHQRFENKYWASVMSYIDELLEQAEARGYRLGLADKGERR